MPVALATFWLCVAACAVAHVGILRSVLRRQDDVSTDVPRPNRLAELLWAVVPLVTLAVVLLVTFPRVRENAFAWRAPSPPASHQRPR